MTSPDRNWQEVLSYLPADYRELAVEHKQVRTQWANAKIVDADDLLRLIFLHVGANLPLRQTVAWAGASGGSTLSAMRFHMRLRGAAPYLQALVQRMVQPSTATRPELWGGYDLLAIDATSVSGPGATGTDARLHTALRLSDLSLVHVEVTDVRGGESLKRFALEPGQLAIVDRGYSTAPGIAAVVNRGADVLVRVNRGALPIYDESNAPINVLSELRSLVGHRANEWPVRIRPENGELIEGRLIAIRLPEKETAEARARVIREARQDGTNATPDTIEAAGYVALFTTVPATRLSAARCVETYRLRWQVELLFKRWKSLCGFDRLPNYRDDTIRSWLYAKVLLGLILDHMGASVSDVFQSAPSARTPSTEAPPRRPLATEPWKVTSILWPALLSAIIPMGLAATLSNLPMIAARLRDDTYLNKPRQLEAYRDAYIANTKC